MTLIEQIQQLPLREKFLAMEAIWDGISKVETALDVPRWHKELLDQREGLIAEGKAQFLPWDDAKEQIKKTVQ